MLPDFIEKWENILDDVDKQKIPIEFIKKIVLKLEGKKQHTINIEKLLGQGVDPAEVEYAVSKKLLELEQLITTIEFILNIQKIAEIVQPETDLLLSKLQ